MEKRTRLKLVIGIALVLVSILLLAYVIISVKANIPEAGYKTGAGTLKNYIPPYKNAGLVMVLLIFLAAICFLGGVVTVAIATSEKR